MLGCYDALQKKYVSLPVSFVFFKCMGMFIYRIPLSATVVVGLSGYRVAQIPSNRPPVVIIGFES